MTTENKLAVKSAGFNLPVVENKFEKTYQDFAGQTFLARLQLEGSQSKLVKRSKVDKGSYCFHTGKDKYENLGQSVDVLVLSHRFKAIDMRKIDKPKVIVSYDAESEASKRIMGLCATLKDKLGLAYGNELLLWIPSVKNEVKYATLHLGSPSSRQVAGSFMGMIRKNATTLQKQATLKWKLAENDQYIWEVMDVFPCNTELSLYPNLDEAIAQIKTFNNPIEGIFEDEEAATEEEVAATTAQEV